MSGVITALSLTALGLLILLALGAAIWKLQNRGEWGFEDAFCTCGHDFYDHIHHTNEQPCTRLMCSCYHYTKENL